MAAPVVPMKLPALDNTVGAFVIGTFLSVFLGGVTTTQCFTYHIRFHRTDRLLYKTAVYFLFLLDMTHSAFCCFTIYYWTVTNYGNPAVLLTSPWSFNLDPAMIAITTAICQAFFAYRVYIVSGRKWHIPAVIATLSAIQFGFGIGATAEIYVLDAKFTRFHEWTYGVTIWLVSAATADVIITSSLVYYLRKASSNEYSKTQTLVARIIRNTIETNGLTMIVAVIDTILFIIYPSLAWHVIPNLLLIKLYYNSLLVSLVGRPSPQDAARASDYASSSSGGQLPYKSSPTHSGKTIFVCNGSSIEGGQNTPHVVVQTQSVIECEKAHPYTDPRIYSGGSFDEEEAIDSHHGAIAVPFCDAAVHTSWQSG